jgi:NTP pyrophosphatase (non-canonical NTP hydrolase)
MSNLQYTKVGLAEARVMEECAELIHAIAKAQRFGWNNKFDGRTNLEWVLFEIEDVLSAIERFKVENGLP